MYKCKFYYSPTPSEFNQNIGFFVLTGTLGYLAFDPPLHDGIVFASRADDMRICC